jgi:hypothetical protein
MALCRPYDPCKRTTSPPYFREPNWSRQSGGKILYDVLVIVLGTGTILLMGAYAELCDRI